MSERLSARACTIGLDLGTTTLKAIAFDDGAGQPVARAAATIPLLDTPDVDTDADAPPLSARSRTPTPLWRPPLRYSPRL